MHGAMVFGELTPTEAFFAAAEGRRPLIDLGGLPDEYRRLGRLIEQCWHHDYEKRPPTKEVVSKLLDLLHTLEHKRETPELVQDQSRRATTLRHMSPLAPAVGQQLGSAKSRIGMRGVMTSSGRPIPAATADAPSPCPSLSATRHADEQG